MIPRELALSNFYKSRKWKIARQIKIADAKGICEKCGMVGTEVHHKIHLTVDNVNDPMIALNQDNLILLCKECHNREHKRWCDTSETTFDEDGNLIKRS